MASAKPTPGRVSLGGIIITQAIAFVFFFVLPVVITLVVPFSTIEFRKSDAGNTVAVDRYVLIYVPWRTQRIENVTRLRADITAEKIYKGTAEERRKGQKGTSYATGQVAIIGDGPEVIVQASPDLAREIVARFEHFAAARSAPPVSIPVYASWSLSYLLGGAVSALCAFYVAGVLISVLLFPFKRMRSRKPAGA